MMNILVDSCCDLTPEWLKKTQAKVAPLTITIDDTHYVDDGTVDIPAYLSAMKAKNETAEQFQALIADEVIPQIRKTGGYQSKPLSPLELFAQSVAAMQAMEEKQKALEGRQDTVEKKVASMGDP